MREDRLTAPDGRRVAFAEFGDPAGLPIFHCHGSAESRLFAVEPRWTAGEALRVVTIDRPGFGASSPLSGRTLLGWAADVAAVAAHLGIDEFSVLGWSGGGPHALALAHVLRPRVRAVAVVGGLGPTASVSGALEALDPGRRFIAELAPKDPAAAAALVEEFATGWVADPDTFTLGGESPPADVAVLAHPEWGENLRAQIREGLRAAAGVAWDAACVYGSWGFDPAGLDVPAFVWHGDDDRVNVVEHGRWLAGTVPGAVYHEVAGAGHFVIYPRWREIVMEVADASR